ncbi:phosphoribosylamine--glycine ligase [Candidatus Peregrinibacteria bacterium]|nr:MAG: phosphoribosylamine--glycine ligase [Candidatus Peregrinibacteria bacterium]
MKKILLVGNGAREHCIAETLKRSPQEVELGVFATAVNPGIKELASEYHLADSLLDFEALKTFAMSFKPDFAFVGPDDPIGAGAADVLLELGIRSVAPLKSLARLESSKSFTRDLVEKYGILGNPRYKVFFAVEGLKEWMAELGGEYVVKADGLLGGKGVQVSGEHLKTFDEGVAFAQASIEKFGRVVVEEKFVGVEFSLMSFCDGTHVVDMPAVQDHKRAFEGDTGPNTGGMGTYGDANGSLPFLTEADLAAAHEITVKVAAALKQECGAEFKGIMYGGFMAVKDGVRLIEYNARFGDPEVMNVLPLLQSDFVTVCEAILEGTLDSLTVEFEKKATVVKYLCPEGYPTAAIKNVRIELGPMPEGVKMYYASVDSREDGLYLLGSRAIAMVGMGSNLAEAERAAEAACAAVTGPVFHRRDVGTAELIGKRVEMMRGLRESL